MDIRLLCLVCERDKSREVLSVFGGQKTFFSGMILGKGTASSKILNYLGLGATEKAVFLSALSAELVGPISKQIDERLHIEKPGHGIVFAAKLHHGCFHTPISFGNRENGENDMQKEVENNLIIVILNRGYSDEVMEAAREAGAKGGTILNARGCGSAGMEKFFGITISPEREVILLVVADEVTQKVMNSIAQKTGPESDAGAISFSLPVSDTMGLANTKQNEGAHD